MDTDSNYFAFTENALDEMIKPEMREEYNFLPRESEVLHPTFKVDGKAFTIASYDKSTPGLFNVLDYLFYKEKIRNG